MNSFSLLENPQYSLILDSNKDDYFPRFTSLEKFIGRKCFEFSWVGDGNTFTAGLSHTSSGSLAFFYGIGQFKSRPPDHIEENEQITELSITFEKNKRYMICFDMLVNKIMLIHENNTFIYNHKYMKNSKWSIFFSQGRDNCKSTIKAYFDYPFHNQMPIAFYSLIDRRCYDFKSNEISNSLILKHLFFINIIY